MPETGGVKLVAGQGEPRSPVTPNCGWPGRAARERGVAATAAGRGAFHGHVVVLTPGTRTPRAGPTTKPAAALNFAGVIVRSASRLHLPESHAPRPQALPAARDRGAADTSHQAGCNSTAAAAAAERAQGVCWAWRMWAWRMPPCCGVTSTDIVCF